MIVGTLSRLLTLRSDYRQYPSTPAGYVSALALGLIASFIGAEFVPALVGKEYTAATFLTVAATQFRDVRKMERETLKNIEGSTLVERGPGYIEGIAKVFEERNYLAMGTALVGSTVEVYFHLIWGAIAGLVALGALVLLASGRRVGQVMVARVGKIWFKEQSLLMVDDCMMMEVGLRESQEKWLKEGVGIMIEPRNAKGQAVLWDYSQRQAIAHDVAAICGVQTDVGYPELTPLVRMTMPRGDGTAALAIIPVQRDVDALIHAVHNVPVLETAKGHPITGKFFDRQRGRERSGGGEAS